MGWYVTCSTCKATEKYSHPACGCLEKKRVALTKKLIDAKVVDCFVDGDMGYAFLNTRYSVGDDEKKQFATVTVIENGSGEHAIHETFYEITIEEFTNSKADAEKRARETEEREKAEAEAENASQSEPDLELGKKTTEHESEPDLELGQNTVVDEPKTAVVPIVNL